MKKTFQKMIIAALALITVITLAGILSFTNTADALGEQLEIGRYYEIYVSDMPSGCVLAEAPAAGSLVPGMYFVGGPGGIYLEGTPTTAGTYSGTCTVTIGREWGNTRDQKQISWSVTISGYAPVNPVTPVTPSTPATPGTASFKITKHPTSEELGEGGSATFVARGDGFVTMDWYLISPEGKWYNVNEAARYFSGLSVSTPKPTHLVLSNVPATLNGYRLVATMTNALGNQASTNGQCWLKVNKIHVAVTKHPTGESVRAGGRAEFVTYGTGAAKMEWYLVSPDNSRINVKDAKTYFPGLGVDNSNRTKLILSNIPAELNGYKIITVLSGNGEEVSTNGKCVLTVR